MKKCKHKQCEQQNPQPLTNFNKSNKFKDGSYCYCRKCCSRDLKILRDNTPDKQKGNHLKKFWPGLTWQEALVEYNKLYTQQNGVCKICKNPETVIDKRTKNVQSLAVDHSHITGKVRGLLCATCNKGLGQFRDNIEILKSAIDYLIG